MARTRWISFATIVAAIAHAVVALPVAAQAPEAPHPSPENAKLWAHGLASTSEFAGFINALETDRTLTDDAMGTGSLTGGSFTWTYKLGPPLVSALVLDTTKPATLNVYMGASQGVGRVSVTTKATYGTQVLLEGTAKDFIITPATASTSGLYGLLTWTVTPKIPRLQPGEDLTWTITATGYASSAFVGVGATRGRTHLILPILSVETVAAGDVISLQKDVSTASLEDNMTFQNQTSGTVGYNWTTSAVDVQGMLKVVATNGSLSLTGRDGNGTLQFDVAAGDENATGEPTTHNLTAKGAASGTWNITVTAINFTGSYQLMLAAAPAPPDITSANATTNESAAAEEEGDGIPGLATWAVALAAGVAIGARARRRT